MVAVVSRAALATGIFAKVGACKSFIYKNFAALNIRSGIVKLFVLK